MSTHFADDGNDVNRGSAFEPLETIGPSTNSSKNTSPNFGSGPLLDDIDPISLKGLASCLVIRRD